MLTQKQIACLLVGAFEGGSNYWYTLINIKTPKVVAEPFGPGEYCPTYISYPMSDGGAVFIADMDSNDKPYVLDQDAIKKGCATFMKKYPQHYADVLAENDDATTADAFLQCCLFEDIIYG